MITTTMMLMLILLLLLLTSTMRMISFEMMREPLFISLCDEMTLHICLKQLQRWAACSRKP